MSLIIIPNQNRRTMFKAMLLLILLTILIFTTSLILLFSRTSAEQGLFSTKWQNGVEKSGTTGVRVYHEECGCSREGLGILTSQNKPVNSSCSDSTLRHVIHQNVVSFTFYLPKKWTKGDAGTEDMYTSGMVQNIDSIRKYLPRFVMRIYTDVPPNDNICRILCSSPDIYWCSIRRTPSHGDLSKMDFRTWRFLPLGDPSVDAFLSRDLESVISEREAAAVDDWLGLEDKPCHAMRDKRGYHNIPVLGGLWGARNELVGRSKASLYREQLISRSQLPENQGKGKDQQMLIGIVWEKEKRNNFVAYDSYHCLHFGRESMVRPYPKPRRNANDFAGNIVIGNNTRNWKLEKCPVECRPSYGQDWEYC